VATSARIRSRRPGEGATGSSSASLVAALGALDEVSLELGALDVVECVDGVGAGEGVHVVHWPTPMASRSLMSPSRIRVFAVPTGSWSMLATSVWV
jgi:hypothetical protein